MFNKSNKELGSGASQARSVEVDVSFPPACGALLSSEGVWKGEVAQGVSSISAKGCSSLEQSIRISPAAKSHQHVLCQLRLYISDPIQKHSDDTDIPDDITFIQKIDVRIQISSHYVNSPNSDILLVTNSETAGDRIEAVKFFVYDELKMEMDIWNVDLYGGLQFHGEENQKGESVLEAYQGKTLLFLGEKFQFFQAGQRSITELCDPASLTEAALSKTSFLFLGSSDDKGLRPLVKAFVRPPPRSVSEVGKEAIGSARFDGVKEMTSSICQERFLGSSALAIHVIPVQTRWYRLGKAKPKSEVKRTAKYLRKHLPQERFLVSNGSSNTDDKAHIISESKSRWTFNNALARKAPEIDYGSVFVLQGVPHGSQLIASEAQNLQKVKNTSQVGSVATGMNGPLRSQISFRLNEFERFMIVSSLPTQKRVEMLWSQPSDESSTESRCPQFIADAASLSILAKIGKEIHMLLHKAPWPDPIAFPSRKCPPASTMQILTLHIPTLCAILEEPHAKEGTAPIPNAILDIFHLILASTRPQKKRHIVRSVLTPVCQRRRNLHSFLRRTFSALLKTHESHNTPEAQKEFEAKAKSSHSLRHSARRNTSALITQRIAEFVKKSEHAFKAGHMSGSEIVPGTCIISQAEWDARVQEIKDMVAKVELESREARTMLRSMISAPEPDGMDCSGHEVTELHAESSGEMTVEIDGNQSTPEISPS